MWNETLKGDVLMRSISKSKLFALSITLLGIVWSLALIAVCSFWESPLPLGGAAIGATLAVILADIYLLVFRDTPDRQTVEVSAVPIYYTLVYFVMVVISNTALVLIGLGGFNRVVLSTNALMDVVYVILLLWAEKDTQRLKRQLSHTEQKLSLTIELLQKLGELLSVTEDEEIHKQLLKLKEAVDYSTNISTSTTYTLEEKMCRQLDEVMELIMAGADRTEIVNAIGRVETTWKMRSSMATSMR